MIRQQTYDQCGLYHSVSPLIPFKFKYRPKPLQYNVDRRKMWPYTQTRIREKLRRKSTCYHRKVELVKKIFGNVGSKFRIFKAPTVKEAAASVGLKMCTAKKSFLITEGMVLNSKAPMKNLVNF